MGRQLNVLVACEESGAVRDAFRELGHNAWSCDLQPCDPASKYSGYHLQGNAVTAACQPWTFAQLPTIVFGPWWDLLIAHPPCTYLCNSGVRWLFANPDMPQTSQGFLTKRTKVATTRGCKWIQGWQTRAVNTKRVNAMKNAALLFRLFYNQSQIKHIAIENPIMHQYGKKECGVGKATQVVQPWMFGHPENKATCLWLRNLPQLSYNKPAAAATKHMMTFIPKKLTNRIHFASPGPDRGKLRSKTYPGIALAMATQWSEYIQAL